MTTSKPSVPILGWHTRTMTWFAPDDVEWTYASGKLVTARVGGAIVAFTPPVAISAVLGVVIDPAWFGVAGAFAVVGAWSAWLGARAATAHAWAEREDDLLVKRGRMFRRLTVVPYGRMQYVEVQSGPVARALGIASVQLHTASSGTDASLSGVPADEAARLRDRLTSRGEAKMAGL